MDFPQQQPRELTLTSDRVDDHDDFLWTSSEAGEVGVLGWSHGGTGSAATVTGTTSHPGVISISTGATAANNYRIHMGPAANSTQILGGDIEQFMWIASVTDITNVTICLGFGDSFNLATAGSNTVHFKFDLSVSANWQVVTTGGGSTNAQTSTVAVANSNWYLLEARRSPANAWDFYINGSFVARSSTSLPVSAFAAGVGVTTNENVAKTVYIDYFRMRSKSLGQRYT